MKTLKKVLAMTLAFATAMTMFVSASAAFTDQSDIKQSEAVDTLVALGVIKGNSDGSFAPDKTVTRGEMAKMIYVLRTGSDDGATAYSGLSTKFADISGNWAAPYIKYCSSMGIISGTSATKFDPNATVTGMQAAKMLLVCIGYDASKSGLTGASWSLNTAALGSGSHLFDEIDTDLNTAISRQNVAREVYNAIDADTVVYDANGNVAKKTTTKDVTQKVATYGSDGKINGYTTVVKSQTDNETVGEKYLNLEKTVGVLGASGNAYLDGFSSDAGDNDLYVYDDGNSVDEGNDEDQFSKVTTDYSDLLGARVKVLYKKDHTDEVYGVYAMDENKINVTTVADKLDDVSGETKIKIGDTKYKVADDLKIYINNQDVTETYPTNTSSNYYSAYVKSGAGTTASPIVFTLDASALSTFIDDINTNNGKVIAVSNDNDDKIDVLRIYTKAFGQVTSVTSKGIYVGKADCDASDYVKPTYTVLGAYQTKFLFDDDNVTYYTGIAKDDYVFVNYDYFNDKYVITKADKVTGDVTGYTTKTAGQAEKVTINGTTYNVYDNTAYREEPSLNKECTLYVDGTYAYAVDVDASSSVDSAVITNIDNDYSTMDKGLDAVLLFDDNTTKSVVINQYSSYDASGNKVTTPIKDSTSATNAVGSATDQLHEGALVEYDTSSNKYQLTIINSNYKQHSYTPMSKINAALADTYDDDDDTIGGYEIDDDAVVYVGYYKNSDDVSTLDMSYKAVSGTDFCNYSESKVSDATSCLFLTKESSGTSYAKLGVCIIPAKLSSTGNTSYGYLTEAPSLVKNSGDDTVTKMTVWNGTKEVTLTCDDDYTKKLQKGSFVSYELVNDVANNVQNVVTTTDDNGVYGAVESYNKSTGRISFYNDVSEKDKAPISYCKIVSDSQVVYFNKDDVEGVESGSIIQANESSTGVYDYNVIIVPDQDNPDEIAGLFVETDNELGGNTNALTMASTKSVEVGHTVSAVASKAGILASAGTINYKSTDTSIATVDSNGTVTGVKAGSCSIVATVTSDDYGTFTADCNVTVGDDTTAPTLSGVSASNYMGTLDGATATLNFTSNEAGTYYYVVYAEATEAPTAAQVVAQGDAVAKDTGSAAAAADTASVAGLTAGTAYKAYVVVKDAAGNVSTVSMIDSFTPTKA